MDRLSLEAYALVVARAVATRSEDPRRKVGAVVMDPHGRILGTGYNGLPPGVNVGAGILGDEDYMRPLMIHAETNAMVGVLPVIPDLFGGLLLATTLGPCARCIGIAARLGVMKIVAAEGIPQRHQRESSRALDHFLIEYDVIPTALWWDDYQLETRRTGGSDTDDDARVQWAVGLGNEAGEVLGQVKKEVYHGKPHDRPAMVGEGGDTLWYLAREMDSHEIRLSEVVVENVRKLHERFPDGFKPWGQRSDGTDLGLVSAQEAPTDDQEASGAEGQAQDAPGGSGDPTVVHTGPWQVHGIQQMIGNAADAQVWLTGGPRLVKLRGTIVDDVALQQAFDHRHEVGISVMPRPHLYSHVTHTMLLAIEGMSDA